jgi:RES domain-containing protein
LPLSRELLDYLQGLEPAPFHGSTYRHMFGERPPTLENTLGARWNPSGVAAIYVSLERPTVIAEGDHAIAVQPFRPGVARWVYPIAVELREVIDLSAPDALEQAGVGAVELGDDNQAPCQAVGEAVAWLGYEGLLVPSARATGTNLVIFTANLGPDAVFEASAREALEE